MELMVINNGYALIPATERDKEQLAYQKKHQAFAVTFKQRSARSLDHHRKFFALLQIALDYMDAGTELEALLIWLKLEIGYYDEFATQWGTHRKPKSICFQTMSQEQFTWFYNACFNVLWEKLFNLHFESQEQLIEAEQKMLEFI